jgi:hypothetical protein
MNTPEEEELLIAQVTTAHRARDPDGIRHHPAWYDLGEQGRRRAFDETTTLRKLEAALDPSGLSTTSHAVLSRIRSGS